MRKLYLKGSLGEKFGEVHNLGASVKSARDAIRLISANRPGFQEHLHQIVNDGVDFICEIGDESISEQELMLPLEKGDIVLTPVPAGAGGKIGDVLKIIVGVVLIAVAFVKPGPWSPYLMTLGASLIGMGMAGLMSPDPAVDDDPGPESYLFTGAQQNTREGDPVPLLYGQLKVPGRPIALQMTNGKFKV